MLIALLAQTLIRLGLGEVVVLIFCMWVECEADTQ